MRYLLALLLIACGSPDLEAPAPATEAPAAVIGAEVGYLDSAARAAAFWRQRGYTVTVRLVGAGDETIILRGHDGPMSDCGTEPGQLAIGCTDLPILGGDKTYIHVDATMPECEVDQVVAHEIGHALGLSHSVAGDVMDPTRELCALL